MFIPDGRWGLLEPLGNLFPLLLQVCNVPLLVVGVFGGVDIVSLPVFDLLEYDGVPLLLAYVVLLVLVPAQILLLMLQAYHHLH
jgi:hypothetical protein